ncbi:MAG: hypothetical protein FJX62_08120 [Alphaproteobacteria bacterium]|nr:hypothetical protein [Alphaproteobacteria bacterium]
MREDGHRGTGLSFALVLTGLALAGCASTPSLPSAPSFASVFGTGSGTSSGSEAAGSNALAGVQTPADFECPGVSIRQGASTLTSTSDGAEQNAMNMRYQVGFGQTARECRVANNIVSIKVGVQGRLIVGPAGAPAQVDVPIRFAVVHEGVDPKPIVTKLERLSVAIAPGNTNVLFTHVEENLSFPMPKGADIDSYVIYVGFDPLGARDLDRRRAPQRQAPQRSPRPRQQS